MLCNRIKELRKSYGLSQTTLAQKVGVSKQCVSNWENGYIQPSLDMLIRLTELFSVSADFLLGLTVKQTLDVTGLTSTQIARIQGIINDISQKNTQKTSDL